MTRPPLNAVRRRVRRAVVRMAHRAHASHVGSALSMVDILCVLYWRILRIDPRRPGRADRDRFLLSKAHGSSALYAVLAERGFFPARLLDGYALDGGRLPGHLDRDAAPGIEISAGSLGHGLPIGVGLALALERAGRRARVVVLLGDGECNEGSVWEAAMLAATLRLKHLTAVVDANRLQGFGRTHEIMGQDNLAARWRAFGWTAIAADGHDVDALTDALRAPQAGPKVVIAHTVKGKGVSFMEDRLEWHYRSPTDAQFEQAMKELA